MTGTIDLRGGVLAFTGLGARDTVFLNGTPLSLADRSGNEARLRVTAGFYRIEVRGDEGRPVRKDVDVLPYQKMTVDLVKERNADAPQR